MDASMAFPCFDQPDLKARFTLSVSMPPNWKVISNTSVAGGTCCGILSGIDGSLTIEGMPLKPLDRWNLIGHLIAMHDPEAPALFAAERARDHSGEAQKYAYAAEAGTPDPAIKARYFDQYLHTSDIQEDWLSQSLRPFNQWNQSALTLPYLTQALDALPTKSSAPARSSSSEPGSPPSSKASTPPEAQTAVHAWLAAHPTLDPDLRLKVLEASDALDRTVRIRTEVPRMTTRIGIDTGGTFTDFVLLNERGLHVHKLRSTPQDPSQAILEGIATLTKTLCPIHHGPIVMSGSTQNHPRR